MIVPRGWSRRWLALITLILFGAFALRLWNLGTQSLWHDEAWSVMSAYQPLNPIDPNYPPLFTVLLGVWIRLAGDSVWAMRYWTLLFAVPTVAVVALLVRRWFGTRAAALAALLAAASPSLWVYSQEIRSYVLIPLLVVVLLGLVDALLNGQNRSGHRPTRTGNLRRVWIWLALVEIIMLYSHNLAVPVVAWLNVTVGVVLLFRREWRRLGWWIAVQAGLLILYLPWLITQKPTGTPLNTPPQVNLALMGQIWQSYFTGIKALVGADPALIALITVIGAVLALSLIALVIYRRSQRTWLLISQALLVPLFELIIILAAHIDFHPRYFLAGVPAALMVIAVGIDTLARELLARRPVINGIVWAGATALALITIWRMVTVVYSSPIYQHDDFRRIAEHYAQLGPDDAIIIPYGYEPTLEYYSRQMNFKAKMIGIPLHSSAETIEQSLDSDLKGVKTAEVLTWYQLPADVRGAYSCLLGATKQHTNTLTVSGLQTNAYTTPTNDATEQTAKDQNLDYGDVRLLNVHSLNGRYGSCVMTLWRLEKRSTENWRISAQESATWELARSDSDILNDNQLPTSHWTEGQTGTAFNLLTLPDGAPLSSSEPNYSVSAVIYSADHPGGIPVSKLDEITTDPEVDVIPNLALPQSVSVPDATDIDFGNGLYLHHWDISQGPIQPGQDLRVTLDWWQTKLDPSERMIAIFIQGNGFSSGTGTMLSSQAKFLSWNIVHIPANASGHAILSVLLLPKIQPVKLAEYDITPINRTFTAPPTTHPVNADFVGGATLVGADATQPIKHGDPFSISLVWKVDVPPDWRVNSPLDKPYTVFIHLLDASGQVVAQNDSPPVQGSRPTTSWLEGEYITDAHTLTWNRADYTGPATLEVGLYDPTTQQRVKLADGSDHFVLPFTVTVQ